MPTSYLLVIGMASNEIRTEYYMWKTLDNNFKYEGNEKFLGLKIKMDYTMRKRRLAFFGHVDVERLTKQIFDKGIKLKKQLAWFTQALNGLKKRTSI